jgi:hypothetical protein
LTYTSGGLSAGTTYHYRVLATSLSGDSPASNVATATTAVLTPPSPPSNLSAAKLGKNKIRLAWADNSNNETGFRLLESLDGRNWSQLANVPANTTAYTDLVTRGVRYYYCVAAYNGAGSSGYTTAASAVAGSAVAAQPIFSTTPFFKRSRSELLY